MTYNSDIQEVDSTMVGSDIKEIDYGSDIKEINYTNTIGGITMKKVITIRGKRYVFYAERLLKNVGLLLGFIIWFLALIYMLHLETQMLDLL